MAKTSFPMAVHLGWCRGNPKFLEIILTKSTFLHISLTLSKPNWILQQKLETAITGVSTRVKTVFLLAVHFGGFSRFWGESQHFTKCPSISFVGGVPSVTARGKASQKLSTSPWRLCVEVLICTSYLTWKDWESYKNLCFPPEVPQNAPPPVSGGNLWFQQIPFRFR